MNRLVRDATAMVIYEVHIDLAAGVRAEYLA